MFGGNEEKERIFKENLEQVKERFLHTMYNITAKREKILFNSKLNRLVTLVRKTDKQ